ncbi:hypothetical protein AVEN_227012-1 [Araneus ventricosus]|uniref:Uncharacterized protein n=1 Tax=Araneus ventricosus TaxID=182803 RepID=A0A4Y2IY03_ARAVE|nr:hypothetical protein AVEN_227012-1 [Araneus ventricosus]
MRERLFYFLSLPQLFTVFRARQFGDIFRLSSKWRLLYGIVSPTFPFQISKTAPSGRFYSVKGVDEGCNIGHFEESDRRICGREAVMRYVPILRSIRPALQPCVSLHQRCLGLSTDIS